MDINRWNESAYKAENISARYDQRILRLKKKIDGTSFICPWCGKLHPINEAKTMKIVAGKDVLSKQYNFNSTTTTYVKTTYKVRFCKQCFDKNERNKKIFFSFGKIIYVLLGLLLLYWMFTTDEKLGFTSVLGTIGMYGIIALCAIGWKDSVIENFFDTANIEEAYKDNAII